MKKLIPFSFLLFAAILLLQSFNADKLNKKDGAAPGFTGSPGDSLKNCTNCHGGVAVPVENWITSNIPSTGYIPGEKYTITASNNENGATRFGFEVSPQNLKGDLLGQIIVTDTVRTKLVGEKKYITYTENGVEGINTLSWSFDWVAPKSGTGNVTFYGAFNSNFDGHKEDDKTYLSKLSIKENGTGVAKNLGGGLKNIRIYPNPASDYIHVSIESQKNGILKLEIIDLKGKLVDILTEEASHTQSFEKDFKINHIPNGIYLLRVNLQGESHSRLLKVSH